MNNLYDADGVTLLRPNNVSFTSEEAAAARKEWLEEERALVRVNQEILVTKRERCLTSDYTEASEQDLARLPRGVPPTPDSIAVSAYIPTLPQAEQRAVIDLLNGGGNADALRKLSIDSVRAYEAEILGDKSMRPRQRNARLWHFRLRLYQQFLLARRLAIEKEMRALDYFGKYAGSWAKVTPAEANVRYSQYFYGLRSPSATSRSLSRGPPSSVGFQPYTRPNSAAQASGVWARGYHEVSFA